MSANPGLAYQYTPPFSAPLRFFLTAPLFGVVAGLVLLFAPGVLESRWTPPALALVHLFAAGFMLQVMLGALLQVLPVVAGAAMPAPARVAGASHLVLAGGTLALAWGLGRIAPEAILAGAGLLAAGLLIFLAAAVRALLDAPATAGASRTPRDLRYALAGLAVTAALGVLLALVLSRGLALPVPLPMLVDLHAGWGWLGWGGLLLAATSWVVVPMFQITPAYPERLTRHWAPTVLVALLAWSAATLGGHALPATATGLALLALAALFAIATVRLQSRSRRSTPDASFRAFRLAMFAALGGLVALLGTMLTDIERLPVVAGVLVMHGAFGGAISAMLYKIVPFLTWLHLTQAGIKAPNMKKLLPDAPMRRQLQAHAATLAVLLAAAVLPVLAPLAGLLLMVEFGWLFGNLLRAVRAGRRARG
ncbi:MAG: hypothetical protein GX576_14020 [Thauera phenolivorans]|uniref:Uncharacterized protein n=1 Tax=Thauera phenolivorans TaxID=1792543 RepID=A0A7X7LY14_9RHOO|nr:hypothetical protein [Thauera phenolivorans]